MKKSKKIKRVVLIILSIFVLGGASFAWFVDSEAVVNVFRTLFLFQVEVVEEFTPSESVPTDKSVTKVVSVKNMKDTNAFVRVMVYPVVMKGEMALSAQIGKEVMLEGLNTTDWKKGEDGYYYYLKVLSKGETTPPLFKGVKLDGTTFNKEDYEGASFDIVVKSEAIDIQQNHYRTSWWQNKTAPTETNLLVIDTILSSLNID